MIGSIKRDTDLLIEYTLMRIDLQRFGMLGGQFNRKLLIAEALRVHPIFFILILVALNACLHPIMGELLDLVVSLHFIRYNDYILLHCKYISTSLWFVAQLHAQLLYEVLAASLVVFEEVDHEQEQDY